MVLSGVDDDYLKAYEFLLGKVSVFLNDPEIGIYYETPFISKEALYLTKVECAGLTEIFKDFSERKGGRCHDYFDTVALGDEVGLLVSYREYDDRIFEDDEEKLNLRIP